jgi:hypothetical protein
MLACILIGENACVLRRPRSTSSSQALPPPRDSPPHVSSLAQFVKVSIEQVCAKFVIIIINRSIVLFDPLPRRHSKHPRVLADEAEVVDGPCIVTFDALPDCFFA